MARNKMAEETLTKEEQAAAEKSAKLKPYQDKADEANKTRTGKGTRMSSGLTRGKGSNPFVYERFDTSLPDTLPTTRAEFAEATKGIVELNEEKITDFLLRGFNDWSLEQASDPIAEYVNDAWPDDKQLQFRIVVRNTAKMLNVSIEDAAKATLAMMK